MLKIYQSNALDVLKELLLNEIQRNPLQDPFQQEKILVQSPGMAQWLKLELAAAQGIAASVDFPLPASFLWQCFADVLEGVPQRSAFNKEAMTWKLMDLLPPLLEQNEFADLKRYLAEDSGRFKLYQLCGKIADIFDQYLVYRPDWIEAWEGGDNLAASSQPWQPVLWRALVARTAQRQQPHWHRGNMFRAFVEALSAGDNTRLPERLFVFGISALPENFLAALQAIGQRIDVHLMVTNPCRYYWGEIMDPALIARISRKRFEKPGMDQANYFDHGNPLLASMGKLGRDYLVQLQELKAPEVDAFADIDRDSLLHQLQADILHLEDRACFPADAEAILRSDFKTPIKAGDRSIQLHSCHSPLREVEVLHDQLLALLEANPELKPRDIIVMMPDVATYAPYIDAVFGNAPPERYIPFSISDRSARQESPLLQSFLRFIALAESRMTVSEVLEMLEVPAVMRRFGLDSEGFHRIRHWVSDVNIRWGLDSERRTHWELPPFEQNSWRFGLRRMLAGYAMGGTEALWCGIAPYGEIEGLESELLGKLAAFVDHLEHCADRFVGEASAGQWIDRVNQLLGAAYSPDEQDEVALDQIRQVLVRLQEQTGDAGYEADLSIDILRDYLEDGLNGAGSGQRFMVGAVNFCTLMPMRSIPFPLVCLLGMNDSDYPRTLPPLGFDLMSEHPQRGDRSRRDDDRYLFLEALMSAQTWLYISYVGRSIQDNQPKVPSVLVSEVLDYLTQAYVLSEDQALEADKSARALRTALTTEHPLAPFSARYFDSAQTQLFSYASEWLVAAQATPEAAKPFIENALPEDLPAVVELADLLRFYRNPCRTFFTQRLKVYFDSRELQAQDDEPFLLEGLDAFQMRARYLTHALRQESLDGADERVRAEGLLPYGYSGQQLVAKVRKDCEELAEKIEALAVEPARRRELRIELDQVTLTGWQDGWHGNTLLRYRPSQVKGHDRLSAWIEHLAACAALGDVDATLHRGLSGLTRFHTVPADRALAELESLVAIYREGLCYPLPFEPAVGWAYLKYLEKGEQKAEAEARKRFEGGYNSYGAVADPYLARVYPDYDSFSDGFYDRLNQIMTPMLDWMEESDD